MLNNTIESIKSLPHVNKVGFSEVISVVDKRDSSEIEKNVKTFLGA